MRKTFFSWPLLLALSNREVTFAYLILIIYPIVCNILQECGMTSKARDVSLPILGALIYLTGATIAKVLAPRKLRDFPSAADYASDCLRRKDSYNVEDEFPAARCFSNEVLTGDFGLPKHLVPFNSAMEHFRLLAVDAYARVEYAACQEDKPKARAALCLAMFGGIVLMFLFYVRRITVSLGVSL